MLFATEDLAVPREVGLTNERLLTVGALEAFVCSMPHLSVMVQSRLVEIHVFATCLVEGEGN